MIKHLPVLLQETIHCMAPHADQNYIDATLGYGGHAKEILKKIEPNGILIGIDRDEEMLGLAKKRLDRYTGRVRFYRGNFDEIRKAAESLPISGVLADLGVSSYHLDTADRGFSFRHPARLDMRMDRSQARDAYQVVNSYSEKELADLIVKYSDERFAGRIARRIVETRAKKPIESTTELAEIIERSIPRRFWPKRIHPATRTFQAIRMEVNQELESLGKFLTESLVILVPGGRLGVISFHGLEDDMVREFMKREANPCECPPDFPTCVCGKKPTVKIITKKPIIASEEEIADNPRSRSAKLRIVEKI